MSEVNADGYGRWGWVVQTKEIDATAVICVKEVQLNKVPIFFKKRRRGDAKDVRKP